MIRHPRRLIAIAVTIIIIVMVVVTMSAIQRFGKTKVTITVVPDNATITLDGTPTKAGTYYLTKGTYIFKASLSGFNDALETIKVGTDAVTVPLLPEAVSDDAQKWLADHPDIQAKREELGSINAGTRGNSFRAQAPVLASLPHIDSESLYSIDYGFADSADQHPYLIISNSSPEGRQRAITWLKSQGVDPALLDIRYDDFQNPLTT